MAGSIKVATAERYAAEQPMAWHNARLIAAAPDLLEALEGLLDLHSDDLQHAGPAWDAASAAIAKAKGE